jgi:hypothetical protein
LDALLYRVGTHGSFLETMKAGLASVTVEAPGADGETLETFQPLRGLTTRDPADPAIALLDGWATVGDVLTFYQERIANEGYLRTATERRSILELSRLVGYALRPGVASTVYLAYTLEEKQTEPVEIPAGARSQSIPGPDELPQSFETSEKLTARSAWNNLQVRLTQPQNISLGNILSLAEFYITGTAANLKQGDSLLFVFGDGPDQKAVRTVYETVEQVADDRTLVRLTPLPAGTHEALPVLVAFIKELEAMVSAPGSGFDEKRALACLQVLHSNTYLGLAISPLDWLEAFNSPGSDVPEVQKRFEKEIEALMGTLPTPKSPSVTTSPGKFISHLLREPRLQPANSARLSRSLQQGLGAGADAHAQLMVNFAAILKDTFYVAWAKANVQTAESQLKSIHVLRLKAPPFGANAPKRVTYEKGTAPGPEFVIGPPSGWLELPLEDESEDSLSLDQAYDAVTPGSYAVIQTLDPHLSLARRQALKIETVSTGQRSAYGVNGKSTKLTFSQAWWPELESGEEEFPDFGRYRNTLVFAQSDPLTPAEAPMAPAEVKGQEIPLAGLYNELTSGRWVIFSGERADIPGVDGVNGTELLMISGLRQSYDPKLPGDKTHTTLFLATKTAFSYKRDTLKIYGNVVKATHGETRNETLGAGDGSQALQSFTLKQPPLTFVPAPNPSGVDSTLKVYVNDVEWHETDTFAGLGPKDRQFIAKTGDDTKTTVTFGNGKEGARLPTGVENVKAIYRNGIGQPGNVRPEQVSLLMTKPLGVKAVINPLGASGGADRESRDQARENAPLGVMSLDRLVSVQDYADFSRTFAGIGKARARRLSDGRRAVVHITIAGADDIPIDPTSDLYANLLAALREFGDADLPLQVDSRELVVLVLSARVRIAPGYLWEPVATAIRNQLLVEFGFEKRGLGQPALLCEVIEVIQSVPGVLYVDVDVFGGIPEKKAEKDGDRRLLTLAQMAEEIKKLSKPEKISQPGMTAAKGQGVPRQRVDVNLADVENGAIRPAQLAMFTAAVPDTLILNPIP